MLIHALIHAAQQRGALCMLVDCGHRFDLAAAEAAGVVTADLLVAQPDTPEQAIEIADACARTGTIGLVVLDGLPCASLDLLAPMLAAARPTGACVAVT